MPRPDYGRAVGAGSDSAADERARHQAELRGDLGLVGSRRAQAERNAASPLVTTIGAALLVASLIVLVTLAATYVYVRTLSSPSATHVRVRHANIRHAAAAAMAARSEPSTAEAAPVDAAAEWDAAHPAPPEDDTVNQ